MSPVTPKTKTIMVTPTRVSGLPSSRELLTGSEVGQEQSEVRVFTTDSLSLTDSALFFLLSATW